MAEGGHAGAPPVRLWVRRVGVYCDEHRKTWLVAAEEASVLRASPWSWLCCRGCLCCTASNCLLSLLLSPRRKVC